MDIPDVYRIENISLKECWSTLLDMTHAVYAHEKIYGQYFSVNDYIAAPPDEVYSYLADTRSLCEWTYSLRGFRCTEQPGLWVADDLFAQNTQIYIRTVVNLQGRTVDYHCAWDQGEHLWMIYLMRVVDAQLVLNKSGSVVLCTSCRHPFYGENGYPDTAPPDRPVWVGDYWHLFPAKHMLELRNLKAICEYRRANGLPVKPEWMSQA
ncbi:SRPBCC family protein [Nocardia transvalensis]|nr:SRPBCC family protein [Nocardia transvalensis]MBF6332425.1 SRPBCC family protein [Nocardia transvalensis]